MRMTENKARIYRFLSITNWSLAEVQEFLIYRNTEITGTELRSTKLLRMKS